MGGELSLMVAGQELGLLVLVLVLGESGRIRKAFLIQPGS